MDELLGEKLEWINKVFKVFEEFAPRYLMIRDKSGKVVPLVINKPQRMLLDLMKEMLAAGVPVRIIILKARQVGISTFIEAVIFHLCIINKYAKAAIIAHKLEATNNLYEMTQRYYKSLPPSIKPKKRNSNQKKLHFALLDSVIKVFTAGAGGSVGHSDTLQYVHISELALWKKAKDTLKGLLETVPMDANTMIFIESTGNGIGGEFYDRFQDAWEGISDYRALFIAWWQTDDYYKKFSNDIEKKEFKKSLSEYEKSLHLNYGVTLEQLNWRRYKIRNDFKGEEKDFREQYPSTPDEAFIASGRPVFDIEKVDLQYHRCEKEKYLEGNLEFIYDDNARIKGVTFVRQQGGYLRIYDNIEYDKSDVNRFAAGVDVAEGLEQGDFSEISVKDRKKKKTVLVWHGHIDPDLLGYEIYKIHIFLGGKIYFNIEFNNHGLTTIVKANELGVKQYYRQDKLDEGISIDTNKLGYKTSSLTKRYLIDKLKEAIRENYWIDNEKEFWGQCRTFVKNEHGQMQAQGKDRDPGTKCFDDKVMSRALMIECDNWMGTYGIREKETETKRRSAVKKLVKRRSNDKSSY